MRALNLILISTLAGLWVYFAVEVAPENTTPPIAVKADGEKLSAATLNNEGVRLDREGRAEVDLGGPLGKPDLGGALGDVRGGALKRRGPAHKGRLGER